LSATHTDDADCQATVHSESVEDLKSAVLVDAAVGVPDPIENRPWNAESRESSVPYSWPAYMLSARKSLKPGVDAVDPLTKAAGNCAAPPLRRSVTRASRECAPK